jgi:hypothetical protein
MCDTLITKDGIEIRSLGDAKRYGLPIPDESIERWSPDNCLCRVALDELLDRTKWRPDRSIFTFSGGWAEIGDDGRTWPEGYDITHTNGWMLRLFRGDGRQPLTLEEWEKGQKGPKEAL